MIILMKQFCLKKFIPIASYIFSVIKKMTMLNNSKYSKSSHRIT